MQEKIPVSHFCTINGWTDNYAISENSLRISSHRNRYVTGRQRDLIGRSSFFSLSSNLIGDSFGGDLPSLVGSARCPLLTWNLIRRPFSVDQGIEFWRALE